MLASLNHPHIPAVYGLDEGAGTRAIIIELVEGDTLAERIARGPLPLAEALPIKQGNDVNDEAPPRMMLVQDWSGLTAGLR